MACAPDNGLIVGDDGIQRCWWHGNDPEYLRYHDEEWGVPVKDDIRLFEKISLEGFQAGLSWLTILRKRDNFRQAFDGFDFIKIAKYDTRKVDALLNNEGIIRHRGKIEATINNAARVQEIITEHSSFAAYVWSFEPLSSTRPKQCDYKTLSQITMDEQSKALSKDLKKRGFKFVGPTTCYAFMQSMGIVNDHVEGCCCREKIHAARQQFKRPK
jgi:DNA-3-methyladenine glycosylase I